MLKFENYNKGLIYTDTKSCYDCNKCIDLCPVLAANLSVQSSSGGSNTLYVDDRECILCGSCLQACSRRQYADDCEQFFAELEAGREFSAIVSPSLYLNHPEEYDQLLGLLCKLGVKKFYSLDIGSGIAAWGYFEYLGAGVTDGAGPSCGTEPSCGGMISQSCPTVVRHIETHFPKLIPKLMPIQSPLLSTAIYLKKYKNVREDLVFLSPCVSCKSEINSKRGQGLIRHNLTYNKLLERLREHGPCSYAAPHIEGEGELHLPSTGSMRDILEYYLGPEAAIFQITGSKDIHDYLHYLADHETEEHSPMLTDLQNCKMGCLYATGLEKSKGYLASYRALQLRKQKGAKAPTDPKQRLQLLKKKYSGLRLADFMCSYEGSSAAKQEVTDAEIEAVFQHRLKKTTAASQRMDCSACGYWSCRNMARAIAMGINHPGNCTYFVRSSLVDSVKEKLGAEEWLRMIIDNMPMVTHITDRNMGIIDCNEEAVNLFGLRDKHEYIERFSELFPIQQPDGRNSAETAREIQKEAYECGYMRFEWMHQDLYGNPIPCEVTLIRINWQGNEQILCFTRDLREYYVSQEISRLMSQRLQAMLDAWPYICSLFDDNYRVIETNQASVDLFGLSDKQYFIDHFYELCPRLQPDGTPSQEKIEQLLKEAFDTGSAHAEFLHQTPEGLPIPCEVHLRHMKLDAKNLVIAYLNDMRPIHAAMAKEREANVFNRALLDSAPFVINIWDEEPRLISTSKQAVGMFGLQHEQQYIDEFHNLSPEFQPCGTASSEKALAYVKEAFRTGYARFEWMHRTTSGEAVPCEIMLVRSSRQGRNILMAYTTDLRAVHKAMAEASKEERLREIAEEESRSKTRFLARMSHEIRTPMNAVLGITEIQLLKGGHPADTEDALMRIHSSSHMLLGLLRDILDLSKVEAGKMEIVPVVYESASLIADTVQLNLMYIGGKDIEFRLQVDEKLPAYMKGDELRIKQVMNNLLSNAIKYTSQGMVSLSFGIESKNENTDTFIIVVSDTGQGMSREQVNDLFDKEFTRFNLQSNRAIEGSGLGMPIAYSLVTMMQGEILVDSQLEKGSTFTVRIPQQRHGDQCLGRERAEDLQNLENTQRFSSKMAQLTREPMPYGSVLVVDDVDSNLFVAKGLLVPYLLQVDTASSGYEAINLIKKGKVYDIIFMDHMMPEMDGIEALRAIRKTGYKHPVVVLTANATRNAKEMFLEAGFDAFVSKPIDPYLLDEVLNKYIKK